MHDEQDNKFVSGSDAKSWMEEAGTWSVNETIENIAGSALISLGNMVNVLRPELTIGQARQWVMEHVIQFSLKDGHILREVIDASAVNRTYPKAHRSVGRLIEDVKIHKDILPLLGTTNGKNVSGWDVRQRLEEVYQAQPMRSLSSLAQEYNIDYGALRSFIGGVDGFEGRAYTAFKSNLLSPAKNLDFRNFTYNAFIARGTNEQGQADLMLSPLAILLADFPALACSLPRPKKDRAMSDAQPDNLAVPDNAETSEAFVNYLKEQRANPGAHQGRS